MLSLLLAAAAQPANAVTRGIATDAGAFPFVVDLASGAPLRWHTGRAAEYIASSAAVRVSARGVRFVHHSFSVRIAPGDALACARSDRALCEVHGPAPRRVFPVDEAWVVFGAADDACSEAGTRRSLRTQGGTDVSLCDVLSGAQHVLLDARGRLESKTSVLGPWLQSALSLLAVFVVGCVVNRAAGGASQFTGSLACTVACAIIVALVIATHDPERLYVTREDEWSFALLLVYTVCNLARWGARAYRSPAQPAPYSVSVGALNLLSFRLFATMDNPCSPFIMAFVAARVIAKLRAGRFRDSPAAYADLYFDVVVAAVLCRLGFIPQYESDAKAVVHLAVLGAALCAAAALMREASAT